MSFRITNGSTHDVSISKFKFARIQLPKRDRTSKSFDRQYIIIMCFCRLRNCGIIAQIRVYKRLNDTMVYIIYIKLYYIYLHFGKSRTTSSAHFDSKIFNIKKMKFNTDITQMKTLSNSSWNYENN